MICVKRKELDCLKISDSLQVYYEIFIHKLLTTLESGYLREKVLFLNDTHGKITDYVSTRFSQLAVSLYKNPIRFHKRNVPV